jgi:hypothetical protein
VGKGISNCENIETLNVFRENFENFAETVNALKCIRNGYLSVTHLVQKLNVK